MKISKIMFLTLAVFTTLVSSSCRTSRFSENQVQLVQYSLKEADLPGSGWRVEVENWAPAYGGESYGIVYIRDKFVFINHVVSIYSNEDQAQQAYQELEKKWFDVTNLLPEVPYTPLTQDDDCKLGCFKFQPSEPLMDCEYLQRHDRIISFVKINLDKRSKDNLTFEEINNILGILDKRLNEAVLDAKLEGNTP